MKHQLLISFDDNLRSLGEIVKESNELSLESKGSVKDQFLHINEQAHSMMVIISALREQAVFATNRYAKKGINVKPTDSDRMGPAAPRATPPPAQG